MAIRYWLVVQPFDRALAMVEGGFVQAPWGVLEGVEQMRVSDGVALYCPREVNPDGEPLRSVVQAGYVLDDEPYRAGGRGSSPWRREVQWMRESRPAPIRPLRDLLDLTRNDKYWGERLRAGWLELSRRDFEIFEDAVRRPSPEPSALGMGLIRETGLAQTEQSSGSRDADPGEDPYSIRF